MSRILVEEVIDKAKISPFHWRILFWCTLIIIFDGYDLVIYGVVLVLIVMFLPRGIAGIGQSVIAVWKRSGGRDGE